MTLDARVAALVDGRAAAPDGDPLGARLDHYCGLVLAGAFWDAYHQMRADKSLAPEDKKQIINAVNAGYLFQRQLEWGNHGVRRSFRFWSDPQKSKYVERALEIADLLKREITPHVSFGFGSVLGMIRDHDFIPHDDDMDLIIALPANEGASFGATLARLRQLLGEEGFVAPESKNISHLTTARKGFAGTDIFIGFIDPDERVSWFPSARGGLAMPDVFPTQTLRFFGGDCPIPRNPIKYLEVTYGPDWRTPIPNWNHPWDLRAYREFL